MKEKETPPSLEGFHLNGGKGDILEEKLYFKPEGYGKGRKKKQQTEQRVEHKVLKLFCLLLFLLVIVIIIIWLLRGKTTTSGQYPANVKTESLECTSVETIYPKLGKFSPIPKETNLTITAIFSGENELQTISLKNLMTFNSNSEAIVAEAVAHANFNIGLHSYGYNISKFENKFSISEEKLLVNLAARVKEIDERSKDYFLITSEILPTTLNDYKNEYEANGFSCRTSFAEKNN